VVTYEFADMAAWAVWQAHEDVQKVLDELHTLATNVSLELWGKYNHSERRKEQSNDQQKTIATDV